jgi:hypothetical protein
LTGKKGDKTANARPGNKNAAKVPRLGPKHKPRDESVAAPALPQPAPGAKLVRGPRRGRGKTGGRDFASGTNSHHGTVFRRTKAQLPALLFMREFIEGTEGLPVKKVEKIRPATLGERELAGLRRRRQRAHGDRAGTPLLPVAEEEARAAHEASTSECC